MDDALHELDFIVHVFCIQLLFQRYADILLPATEWLETGLILVPVLNKPLFVKRLLHFWETMNETVFWSKLAKRLAEKEDMRMQGCL